MRRLPISEIPAEGERRRLDRESAQHRKVLRLREGDAIELFDGRGGRAKAVLEGEDAVRVIEWLPRRAALPRVELILCLPKLADLENSVRMATELGATAIHLAMSDHSVVKLSDRKGAQKIERLRKIALEASRQSERDELPELYEPAPLHEVLAKIDPSLHRFIALERSNADPLEKATEGAALLIGPEGGFSEAEAEAALAAGWKSLSLGPTILRVSTAVAAAIAHLAALRRE